MSPCGPQSLRPAGLRSGPGPGPPAACGMAVPAKPRGLRAREGA